MARVSLLLLSLVIVGVTATTTPFIAWNVQAGNGTPGRPFDRYQSLTKGFLRLLQQQDGGHILLPSQHVLQQRHQLLQVRLAGIFSTVAHLVRLSYSCSGTTPQNSTFASTDCTGTPSVASLTTSCVVRSQPSVRTYAFLELILCSEQRYLWLSLRLRVATGQT